LNVSEKFAVAHLSRTLGNRPQPPPKENEWESKFFWRVSTQWQFYYFKGENYPQQLSIMKAVNLFNPRNSKLKYEIINPIWEDGLLDPVTMRVQFPVLSRVHGVYLETSERLLTHVIEIAKREISQPGDPKIAVVV
jgi:hypothetical protein